MAAVNPEWLKKFDEKSQPSKLLLQFLEECKHLDISWALGNEKSLEKTVLMVRMTVKDVVWRIFAIHLDRSMVIPWELPQSIVGRKEKFRPFAEALAYAIPGARAYDSGAYWSVCIGTGTGKQNSKNGDRSVEVMELLGARDGVLKALSGLHARLQA